MPRVLTVDDSRAIRSIVSKQLKSLGFDVEEAEHGEEGLACLEECEFDLVLLDVTMPVLDGPGMLEKMRARGDKTPVLMLTSESKRSIVAGVMKLGISDYILKPFKAEELHAKVLKALNLPGGSTALPAVEPPPAEEASTAAAMPAAGRQFVDVLVVDDMDNVYKKLRGLVPQNLSMNQSLSAQASLAVCRERVYRLILIDSEIPDVNSTVLLRQIRTLQPQAACLALALRAGEHVEQGAREAGFDGVLFKPFDPTSIEDLVTQYFNNQELVTVENELLTVTAYQGRQDRLDRYYQRLAPAIEKLIEQVASACFDQAIVDLSQTPVRTDRTPRLVVALEGKAKAMGIELRLVGSVETRKVLAGFSDTEKVPFFASVAEARAA
jgi:two-component system cell cycle response regulator